VLGGGRPGLAADELDDDALFPELALGTLGAARLQGTRVDPMSEEQPGRILV
jgi:hypothetical protein